MDQRQPGSAPVRRPETAATTPAAADRCSQAEPGSTAHHAPTEAVEAIEAAIDRAADRLIKRLEARYGKAAAR